MEGHRPSQPQTGAILPPSASRQGTTYGSTSNTGTPQAQVATALLTGGGRVAMMVDGSGQNRPLHRAASPDSTAMNSATPTAVYDTKEDGLPAFLAHLPPGTPLGSGASRWSKLRTTVQISGAMSVNQKKAPLKREDSFLQRFSTRHIGEAQDADGNPVTEGELIPKPRLWSRSTCRQLMFGVINPDENAMFLWLWLLTVCVLYNAWALILRQTFTEIQHLSVFMWIAFDGFSDFVYLLDIVIQLRTGYLEQGLMVSEGRKLRGHYLRSRSFLLDLVSLTPLDLLQFIIGVTPLLRFPRFIKVYRCYRFYYMVESRTIYPNFWRVANLIHILLLLSHWFGCFHYMLSEFENFRGAWAYTNPYKSDNAEWRAITRKYVASVYWSTLTLTTIGGDHVTPSSNLQYAFTILSYLIGVFIFATIVGQVGNVITNRNASRLEFERLLDGAKLYMRHHKVPHQMQRRVQRWYDYSWSRGRMRGGGDINSALGGLPDKLKTELALHVNLKTLKKVSIFQECQPEFLHDLVLKMRAYIFTPGDLICRKGEVAREMFIIADGILEVISETGKVLTQMKPGDFFGEIGILNLDGFNRRTADVRSVGYSELFSLSREDVLSAMRDYPEAQEILRAMGRKRLMDAGLSSTINCPMQANTPLKQQPLQLVQQEGDVQSQAAAAGPMVPSVGHAPTMEPEVGDTASLPESQKSPKSPTRSPVGTASGAPSTQKSMNTIRKFRKDLKHLLRSGTLASNGSRFHVGHRQTSTGEPVLQSSKGQTIGGIEGDMDADVQDNLSFSSMGPGRSVSTTFEVPPPPLISASATGAAGSAMDAEIPLLRRVLMLKREQATRANEERLRQTSSRPESLQLSESSPRGLAPGSGSSSSRLAKLSPRVETDDEVFISPLKATSPRTEAPEGKWSSPLKDVPIVGGIDEVAEGTHVGSTAAEATDEVRRQLDALASPKKRALWQNATFDGYAERRAVLTRMCAIKQGLSSPPEEDHAGDGGGGLLAAGNITHNNSNNNVSSSNNNNDINSVAVSSGNVFNNNNNNNNNNAQSNILSEDDALTRQSKTEIDDDASHSQQTFIITDQENVELMVTAAMKQIKIAVTDYLKDTHMELTSRVEALEHELEIKDNLIVELQDELIFKEKEFRHQRPGPNFIEDICSLSETSFESDDEDNAFLLAATGQRTTTRYGGGLQVPSSDVFDPSPRNSWPRSGFETSTFSELHANNGIHNHEESRGELSNLAAGDRSASWHDYPTSQTSATEHPGMVVASKMGPEDLWKLEFPQISDNLVETSRRSIPSHDRPASLEKKTNSEKPAKRGSKQDAALAMKQAAQTNSNSAASSEHAPALKTEDVRQASCDDWEVKMLVEQFDEKMKRRSLEGRRHSSCDIQSWERLVLQADPSSSYPNFGGPSRESRDSKEIRRRYGRSSRALFTRGRFPELGTTSRRAEIRRASLARFASVDVPTLQASLDDEAPRGRASPLIFDADLESGSEHCSTDSIKENLEENVEMHDNRRDDQPGVSSQDDATWSPTGQAMGLPTIKEGLRLQGQKSEISDEDEDDSSSTKTTLFIDIDEGSSEPLIAKGGDECELLGHSASESPAELTGIIFVLQMNLLLPPRANLRDPTKL
ncbi:uncharacterized protein LOC100897923 [Galendromus occidentalis]|uniref:Uncharacterized protein LOC100897923 n=1 Tax=Galendromus occidentalis TaxID=34638 RepID=A0AAJ7SFH6_9ACAR|nr:uncharacterized protein LOC100897923 [Galendromus occidentalis]